MPISDSSVFSARFNMVMQPEERAMLQALARDTGLKESDVVRQMIRRDYAAAFGKKKPGAPAAKYNSLEVREARAKRAKK
ncbi:MAG TPA: hypothetical protein VJN18_14500 [Polyangiaceae bacterium]|nr:hypothetical protein [Polyangiaceae bacterium]